MPRVLPRIALAFAVIWLLRNLALDAGTALNDAALRAPFGAPFATHSVVSNGRVQEVLISLAGHLGPGQSVEVQVVNGRLGADYLRWQASYWLFPHRVTPLETGRRPRAGVVVIATSGSQPAAPDGYHPLTIDRWDGACVASFSRD